MLNNANGFKKIYIATGYTDLRRGMEGLAAIIRFQFNLDPYDKDTLFLFCGKRTDRIKGLLWPRSADEAKEISPDQYQMLMQGLEIIARRPIEQIENPPCAM